MATREKKIKDRRRKKWEWGVIKGLRGTGEAREEKGVPAYHSTAPRIKK